MPRRAPFPMLLGLVALLGACAAPGEAPAPRQAVQDCVFGDEGLLPLQDETGAILAAALNGQPLLMELDTGLGLSSLQPEVAQRLKLPEDPRAQSGYAAAGGVSITRPNVLVESLRTGNQDWPLRSIAVRPFYGRGGSRPPFDGVIGAQLLRDAELDLDLGRRRIALHRARGCRAAMPPWPGAVAVPLEADPSGVPYVQARVNGQMVRARIHTGNNVTTLTTRLAARLNLNTPTGRRGTSYGSNATARAGQEYRLAELAVGGEVLRDQNIVVSANEPGEPDELTLGRDWLEQRRVWLSFPTRRLYLGR
ncbi:aspartyl protease family protein [Roseomonas haemaphysalidis]|uniref:Aspartyl protease family protein n=1 Tax=Roseomonas haemaphysalidis TaxID=2768162 RepID=A0ABS3KQS1_9PROT|nr:aspartyl protease family protein [Roseomonas haemaphysalidis]MBO1079800.1 aspartyl protease family protein [Roseomonas haemaphysalidis]